MRGALTSFGRISNAVRFYKEAVSNALLLYKRQTASIREDAQAYKDEKAYENQYIPGFKRDARKAIETAKKELDKRLEDERSALEKQLFEVIAAAPDRAFIDLLRVYRDFDIVPNRMEVGSLLNASHGNAVGIRALNQFLKSSGSGYRIAATPFESFAGDLDRITKLQRGAWLSFEYSKEAGEVFDGEMRTLYRADGTPYQNGTRWDGVSRLMASREFDMTVNELEKASEAWSAEILPKIVEDEDGRPVEKPHDLPSVDDDPASGEEMAAEMGRQQAKEDAKVKSVIDIYSR